VSRGRKVALVKLAGEPMFEVLKSPMELLSLMMSAGFLSAGVASVAKLLMFVSCKSEPSSSTPLPFDEYFICDSDLLASGSRNLVGFSFTLVKLSGPPRVLPS